MTGQLYEGCWGVTRAGEKKGPFPEKSTLPYCYPFFLENMGWREDGRRNGIYGDDPNDIIAIFATEPEADAYLAGDTAEPAGTIYRTGESSYRFEFGDAHNPVMWPDGALSPRYDTRILVRMLDDRRSRSERELILRVLETLHREDEADRAEMAHLAAGKSCDAAADYVEGRG